MQRPKRRAVPKLDPNLKLLRREIKADIRKQHDLYVNNLVGHGKANPRDFMVRPKKIGVFPLTCR